MSLSPKGECVATLVAGSGATITADLLRKINESVGATRIAWLAEKQAADVFFQPHGGADLAALYARFAALIGDEPVDVLIQPAATRRKKLLIADMESTIIEQEMLDELAETIGLRDKVAAITRRAMNGEIDFAEALRERVALLKGQPASVLDTVAKRITYMAGAAELVATMKAEGARCWLVSGGFNRFIEPVAKHLGFDRFYANELVVRGGVITGEVAEPVLDKDTKRASLEKACAEIGVPLSTALAVGDGANDIPMLSACSAGGGLGVAYQAKPKVRAAIPHQINYGDLTTLLYAQGYPSTSFRTSKP